MSDFTLKDAAAIFADDDVDSTKDPRVLEYVSRAAKIGREILIKLSDNEQLTAVSLLQATVMADRLSDSDLNSVLFLMSNIEEGGAMFAIALRLAVGMAAMEEWH